MQEMKASSNGPNPQPFHSKHWHYRTKWSTDCGVEVGEVRHVTDFPRLRVVARFNWYPQLQSEGSDPPSFLPSSFGNSLAPRGEEEKSRWRRELRWLELSPDDDGDFGGYTFAVMEAQTCCHFSVLYDSI